MCIHCDVWCFSQLWVWTGQLFLHLNVQINRKKCWAFGSSTLFSFTTNSTPSLAIIHTRPSFFSVYVSIRGGFSLGWRLGFLDMLPLASASSNWFSKTSENKESSTSDDALLPVGTEPQTEYTGHSGFHFSVHSAQKCFIHQIKYMKTLL